MNGIDLECVHSLHIQKTFESRAHWSARTERERERSVIGRGDFFLACSWLYAGAESDLIVPALETLPPALLMPRAWGIALHNLFITADCWTNSLWNCSAVLALTIKSAEGIPICTMTNRIYATNLQTREELNNECACFASFNMGEGSLWSWRVFSSTWRILFCLWTVYTHHWGISTTSHISLP